LVKTAADPKWNLPLG